MAIKRKDGFKFSETGFGAYIKEKTKREKDYKLVTTFFAVMFGLPVVYLIGRTIWGLIKVVFSIE
jgi:hypothetical protein